jgi:hypothetical protein
VLAAAAVAAAAEACNAPSKGGGGRATCAWSARAAQYLLAACRGPVPGVGVGCDGQGGEGTAVGAMVASLVAVAGQSSGDQDDCDGELGTPSQAKTAAGPPRVNFPNPSLSTRCIRPLCASVTVNPVHE